MKKLKGLLLLGTAVCAILLVFSISGTSYGSGFSGSNNAFVNGTNGRVILVDDLGVTIGPGGVEVQKEHPDRDWDRDRDWDHDRDWDRDRDWDHDRDWNGDRDLDYDRY